MFISQIEFSGLALAAHDSDLIAKVYTVFDIRNVFFSLPFQS